MVSQSELDSRVRRKARANLRSIARKSKGTPPNRTVFTRLSAISATATRSQLEDNESSPLVIVNEPMRRISPRQLPRIQYQQLNCGIYQYQAIASNENESDRENLDQNTHEAEIPAEPVVGEAYRIDSASDQESTVEINVQANLGRQLSAHGGKTIDTPQVKREEILAESPFYDVVGPAPEVVDRCVCPHCNKRYSKPSNLNDHIKSKHNGRRFVCTECNNAFSTKGSLVRHIGRTHKTKEEKRTVAERHDSIEQLLQEQEDVDGENRALSDAAKLAKIIRLEREVKEKDDKIVLLQKKVALLEQELRKTTENTATSARTRWWYQRDECSTE